MSAQHTPGPDLLAGLTDKQLAMHPMCPDCGWRRGGIDSWDGARCKCKKSAPNFRALLSVADRHEAKAEQLDAMDLDGECEPAAAYHETRASEIRAAIAKATGSAPQQAEQGREKP